MADQGGDHPALTGASAAGVVPVAHAGYEPENFDRTSHGEVTAAQALRNSLNVPAVAMLTKVGPEAFQAVARVRIR